MPGELSFFLQFMMILTIGLIVPLIGIGIFKLLERIFK